MKLMIASDVHGSARWCERLLDMYRNSGAERMLLLGDLLYHGPRNDLPEEYAPKKVIELLNGMKESLFCVRGNCEAEVDQMVLKFPVMADYCVLPLEGRIFYATHGHIHGEDNPPPLKSGDYLLCGHTHIPAFNVHDGYTYVNCGSVSIPKNGTPHSSLLLDGRLLRWIDLSTGEAFRQEEI